jgi:hypothetical protein
MEEIMKVQDFDLVAKAISSGATVEVLTAVVNLQLQIKNERARSEFIQAMANFQGAGITIQKKNKVDYGTKTGQKVKYNFAGLGDILKAIGPALKENGLAVRWQTETNANELKVTCIVAHVAGHSETCSLSAGADNSGGKNAIQAVGSTVSYLQRYTLSSLLGIVTDEDIDGVAPEGKPAPTEAQWDKIVDRAEAKPSEFKIESALKHFTLSESQIEQLKIITNAN